MIECCGWGGAGAATIPLGYCLFFFVFFSVSIYSPDIILLPCIFLVPYTSSKGTRLALVFGIFCVVEYPLYPRPTLGAQCYWSQVLET